MPTLGSIPSDRDITAGGDAFPPAFVGTTAAPSAPSGWLLCDGAAVSRTTYAALFAAIGITYGTGNGTTTFNVPDLRGRCSIGPDGGAGRIAANDALGNVGGASEVTLSAAQSGVADHRHDMDFPNLGGANPMTPAELAQRWMLRFGIQGVGGSDAVIQVANNGAFDSGAGVSFVDGGPTPATTPHTNLPPYQVLNPIIKT